MSCSIIKKNYGDFIMHPDISGDLVLMHIAEKETVWDKYVIDALEPYLNSETVLIEAGAYCGDQTIYLAQKCKQVFTFEPQRNIYNLLCGNLYINGITNCIAYNAALSDSLGFIAGGLGPQGEYKNIDDTNPRGIPRLTIDSLNLEACDIIKTDCERMDYQVLLGAKETIAKFHPVIVFEAHAYDFLDPNLFVELLAGYQINRIGDSNDFLCLPKGLT